VIAGLTSRPTTPLMAWKLSQPKSGKGGFVLTISVIEFDGLVSGENQCFSFEGWLSTCYAHQPVNFKMGINAQCVKAASETNENSTVATAARKIQNINLMSGPSGYGVP
jgi:hypothetical protein